MLADRVASEPTLAPNAETGGLVYTATDRMNNYLDKGAVAW